MDQVRIDQKSHGFRTARQHDIDYHSGGQSPVFSKPPRVIATGSSSECFRRNDSRSSNRSGQRSMGSNDGFEASTLPMWTCVPSRARAWCAHHGVGCVCAFVRLCVCVVWGVWLCGCLLAGSLARWLACLLAYLLTCVRVRVLLKPLSNKHWLRSVWIDCLAKCVNINMSHCAFQTQRAILFYRCSWHLTSAGLEPDGMSVQCLVQDAS